MKSKFFDQTGLNGNFIELDYGSYNMAQLTALISNILSFSIAPKVAVTIYSQNNFIGPKYTFKNTSNQFKKIVCFTNVFNNTIRSLTIDCACKHISKKPNVISVTKTNGTVLRANIEFSYTILDPVFQPVNLMIMTPPVAQTIIMFQDFGFRKDQYFCLLEKLAFKGFKCFIMDQRGHGNTGASNIMNWGTLIEDNRAIATSLNIYTVKPILMGHGYGGAISQYWAQLYKVELKKLILIDSAPYPIYPLYQPIESSTQAWLGGLITTAQYAQIVANACYNDTSYECTIDKLKLDLIEAYNAASTPSLKALRLQNTTFSDQLKFIITPTLIIHGAIDVMTVANGGRQLSVEIPHSRLRIISDAGHAPNQTKPLQTLDFILTFAEEHRR